MITDVNGIVPQACIHHFRGYEVGIRMQQDFIKNYTYPDGTEVVDPQIIMVKDSYAYMAGRGTIRISDSNLVTFKVFGAFHYSPGNGSTPDGVAVWVLTEDNEAGRTALMLLRLAHGISE